MGDLGLLMGSVLFKSAEPLKKQPYNPSAPRTAWVRPAQNIPSVTVTLPEDTRPDWRPQVTHSEPLPVETSSNDSNAQTTLVVIYIYSSIPSDSGVRDEPEDHSALAHSVSRAEDSYVARMTN